MSISLAILGGKPRFSRTLTVGQSYWPDWERYEKAVRGIFARRYYTAQRFAGPLVIELQQRLEEFLGVRHAIAVRNATNGLMNTAHALQLAGKVIVPAWTFVATIQALRWSGCQPVFCDIEPESQQMSLASVRRRLERGDIKGILGVHLWGNSAPVEGLEKLAHQYNVPLLFDAAHAFGCQLGSRAIGTFGQAEVFSFHAANIVSTAEGGCLTTNDDALAAELRAMRGDHIPGVRVEVQSGTARMSEVQAAIGLMMLDDFERNRENNEEQFRTYKRLLSGMPRVQLVEPSNVTTSNFQELVCVVDRAQYGLSRDELLEVLRAENVKAERHFFETTDVLMRLSDGALEAGQLPLTEAAAQSTFQLPLGSQVTLEAIEQICEIIAEAHAQAAAIQSILSTPGTR